MGGRIPSSLDRIAEYGLTNDEWAALQLYTTSLYTLINAYLRGYANTDQHKQIDSFMERSPVGNCENFDEFIELIASGMAKLPEYDETESVSRGVGLEPTQWNPEGLLEKYGEGSVVVDEGFMSTTFGTPFAKDSIVILELPTGHPGRDLAWLSKFEQEKEVLFPPGCTFAVTGQLDKGANGFDDVLAYLVTDPAERDRRFGVVNRIVYGTIMNWQINPLYEEPGTTEPDNWQENPLYEGTGWQDNPLYEGPEWQENPVYQEQERDWQENPLYEPPQEQ
jgi:hypothetical protein